MSYISIPAENLQKLNKLSGKTISVYLALRALLFYKKGMRGKLIPIKDIIKVSRGDAEKLGINRKTFGRAIKELVKVGLVRISDQGGFGKGRRPMKYQIL